MARQATRKTPKRATAKKAAARKTGAKKTAAKKTGTGRTTRRPAKKPRKSAARSSARAPAKKASGRSASRRAQEPKELMDLFLETLKDMYGAEKQILRALPKMAKAARFGELRSAFEQHVRETEGQVDRLNRVFEILGQRAAGKKCEAVEGLVEEGKEVMQDFQDSSALDAGLLAGAQAVEHYEISRYGTLKAWASQLGMNEVIQLFEDTLNEEKRTDELLTRIAAQSINRQAA